MKQILSQRRAKGLAFSLCFVGFALLATFNQWWPGILLTIGIPLAVRNALIGRLYSALLCLILFVGLFLSCYYTFNLRFIPIVGFTLAALYFFLNEFLDPDEDEAEIEEDLNHEIEEHETTE